MEKTPFDPEIADACRRYGLDADLVSAVVMQESGGRTNAYRYEPGVWGWFRDNKYAQGLNKYRAAASYGLMQVIYATATDYGFSTDPEYLFLPKIGLDLGCRHLAELLRWSKGDMTKALEAYNGGKGNVGSTQTRNYAINVLGRYRTFRGDK